MAVANVIRVSILGTLPSGEVWSVNPVWQIGGVSTAEDVSPSQANAMAVAVAGVAVPTSLLNMLASSCAVTGARVEARRWDGTLAAQGEALKASPQIGTVGAGGHSYQTAAVFSLRTGGVGARSRGRLYWPATGVGLAIANLRPSGPQILAYVQAMSTYLTSITTALDITLTNSPILSVWSRLNAATTPVNQIQIGDILDVQRRRRDQLIETYQTVSFP